MQLYFIRHAQSENNQKWADTGTSQGRSEDPLLTAIGRKQAVCLADYINARRLITPANPYDELNGHAIQLTHLYTSLMTRAILTAHEVAVKIEQPLYGWVDLHEGGGIYLDDAETGEPLGLPGKKPDELQQLSAKLVLSEINPNGWWNRSFEERPERFARGRRVVQAILEKHGDTNDSIAIFSHGVFFNYFISALFAQEERPPVWFYLNNTGITRIDLRNGNATLVYSNRTEHLPPDLLT